MVLFLCSIAVFSMQTGAIHTSYVEAKKHPLYLIELGTDSDHIIEGRAEHSLENVFYSMVIF